MNVIGWIENVRLLSDYYFGKIGSGKSEVPGLLSLEIIIGVFELEKILLFVYQWLCNVHLWCRWRRASFRTEIKLKGTIYFYFSLYSLHSLIVFIKFLV